MSNFELPQAIISPGGKMFALIDSRGEFTHMASWTEVHFDTHHHDPHRFVVFIHSVISPGLVAYPEQSHETLDDCMDHVRRWDNEPWAIYMRVL